jgi:CubicO group peptidase (beta-lactamase class C family)
MSSLVTLSDARLSNLGFSLVRLERLHRCVERFVEEGKHAGTSPLVLRKGRVADAFATEFRDRALEAPMQRDTIVRIYSMTKIVVIAAAGYGFGFGVAVRYADLGPTPSFRRASSPPAVYQSRL